MDLPTPFGRYQLLERIATGGMAEVFLARSFGVEGFEKRLVIKRILPELASNPRFVSMFVHEAKLSVCLGHPNIVQVFELGKVGNDHYIAMEHIHGRDLTQIQRTLRRDGQRMPVAVAASVAASVARGLAYAHARTTPDGRPLHIVHRDVSPHNIVLSFEGDVKLVDFGIARLAGDAMGTDGAGPGGGKYAYMSPEQASGGALDGRSDVFSLGVVLFEALAGRKLHPDAEPDEKLRMVRACELPPLDEALPHVPAGLRAILARALARDPADRPTAVRLEEDLRAFLFESGARADATQRASFLRGLFPGASDEGRSHASLDRLVDDLQALQGASSLEAGGTVTPGESSGDTHGTASDGLSDGRAQRRLARGERRTVVAMVVEANGLTDFSARAEAEDVARAHYRMLRAVRTLIDRMGGAAERFEDDTLQVYFGLTRTLGDDLDRALGCARELHRLSQRLRKRGVGVEFAIGIHVGELTVAPAGRRLRAAPRGDTLKLAVRLAYSAEPGNTLVSDRVAALAGDRFPLDRGPELRRKGSRGTRPSFVLAGGRRMGARGTAGRWFRRGDEADVLRDAIGAVREGTGARIAVVGEAGIGKSRLFREFRELAARRGVPVFHGRAVPGGADRPLAPFRDLVSDVLGIHPDTGPNGVRERLERLRELELEPADIAVIGQLFSADIGETVPERGRDALVTAGTRLLRGLAADGPIVLMLEDLQHLDGVEAALFDAMLRTTEGLPVLALTSWRGRLPERVRGQLREVSLVPLTPEQVAAMAADLLGAEAIGPDLTRLVARSAEGNPLYLEEIIKALHQAGRVFYEGSTARLRDPQIDPGLPATLQGLIAARIDRLEPAARGALQVAAVIGPTFSASLLGTTLGADDPTALVGELVRAGLIAPESRVADTAYAFASVLIWESVLRGILGVQRREFHRMVASGMERLPGARLDSVEAYATHLHAGGRVRDASAALLRAGDAHRAAQFLERALECYERALGWQRVATRDQDDPVLEARLQLAAGEVGVLLGRAGADRALQAALELAGDGGPLEVEARALLALGQAYAHQGKVGMARAHLDAAIPVFRRLGDREGHVRCLESLGTLVLEQGERDAARAFYEEGIAVAGADGALVARMLVGLASHAFRLDDNPAAAAHLRQALPHAESAGDRILVGRILNNLGIAHFNEGRFAEAVEDFRRALEVRQGIGYRQGEVVNLHNIADAQFRMGELPRAFASFEQSRDLAREIGWERGVTMNDVFLCYLRGLRGEPVAAELDDAVARATRLGDRESAILGKSFLARLKGVSGTALLRQAEADARAAGFEDLARLIVAG